MWGISAWVCGSTIEEEGSVVHSFGKPWQKPVGQDSRSWNWMSLPQTPLPELYTSNWDSS